MDSADRTAFISNYTKLLVATWSDEALGGRLASDPKAVMAQFGLVVPANAQVTVIRQIPAQHGEPDVDFQVNLWEKGLESGEFEMHIPETPQIDAAELSESELEGVAAGWSISSCCCTPCCSCA